MPVLTLRFRALDEIKRGPQTKTDSNLTVHVYSYDTLTQVHRRV